MNIEIKAVYDEFEDWASVIRDSFATVAAEFNITRENAPANPAFAEADSLEKMKEKGISMYGAYLDGQRVGFVALETTAGIWKGWPYCLSTGIWESAGLLWILLLKL